MRFCQVDKISTCVLHTGIFAHEVNLIYFVYFSSFQISDTLPIIIGAVVGGVIVLAAIAMAVFCLLNRQTPERKVAQ